MTRVAVFGSDMSSDEMDPSVKAAARKIGIYVAEAGCDIYTGACNGYPYESVLGVRAAGGRAFGISPAGSEEEHVDNYGFPLDGFENVKFTGRGFAGRELDLVAGVEKAIAINGRIGTLNEITLSLIFGKDLGILLGSGGVSDYVQGFLKNSGIVLNGFLQDSRGDAYCVQKHTGRENLVLYHDDPGVLVATLLDDEYLEEVRMEFSENA